MLVRSAEPLNLCLVFVEAGLQIAVGFFESDDVVGSCSDRIVSIMV